MNSYINTLEKEFQRNANHEIAVGQKAYMRNQFEYYGIKSPIRKKISKPFLPKDRLPDKKDLEPVIKTLWKKPQREFQYFAQELISKYKTQTEKQDIALFEFMVLNKSWWDTVDFISAKIIGNYFKKFPEERNPIIEKWLISGNIWLQRSSILFQLKYKKELDFDFLSYVINSLLRTEEFFINKAIGWILREYGKTNSQKVLEFAEKTRLNNLSRREALRIIL